MITGVESQIIQYLASCRREIVAPTVAGEDASVLVEPKRRRRG